MKFKRFITLIAACIVLMSWLCVPAIATGSFVADNEQLLDGEQAEFLNLRLEQISAEYGIDIYIATSPDLDGKAAQEYADDMLDYHFESQNGILFAVSNERREYAISTVGKAMYAFDDEDLDRMEERVLRFLRGSNYYEAFCTFANEAERGTPDEGAKNLIIISLVAGVIIAFIAVTCMKAQLKSVRMQPAAHCYMRSGSMNLKVSRDRFLFRNISKVPRNNGNSGGSGRHTSSSGRSHGGRSGRF